jgi:hypothetical protein
VDAWWLGCRKVMADQAAGAALWPDDTIRQFL